MAKPEAVWYAEYSLEKGLATPRPRKLTRSTKRGFWKRSNGFEIYLEKIGLNQRNHHYTLYSSVDKRDVARFIAGIRACVKMVSKVIGK